MRRMITRCALILATGPAGVGCLAHPAGAQADSGHVRVALPVSRAALVSRRELAAGGLVALSSIALMPADAGIAARLRGAGPQHDAALHSSARLFNVLGDPGTIIFGVGTYALGRATRSAPITDAGLHTVEAIAASGAVTGLLKGIAGRRRPGDAPGDADEFSFGGGFRSGGRVSYPSGHTTAAFAVASTMSLEVSRAHPRAGRVVGALLYTGAGLVGLSRMYEDRHWASDVVLGAGIGTLSGLTVVRYNHANPRNRVNRWLGAAHMRPQFEVAP